MKLYKVFILGLPAGNLGMTRPREAASSRSRFARTLIVLALGFWVGGLPIFNFGAARSGSCPCSMAFFSCWIPLRWSRQRCPLHTVAVCFLKPRLQRVYGQYQRASQECLLPRNDGSYLCDGLKQFIYFSRKLAFQNGEVWKPGSAPTRILLQLNKELN